jgi:ubiquinone/menaquinone biosynthesis C-methylase UbiE
MEPAGHSAFSIIAPLYDELMSDVPYDGWISYLRTLWNLRSHRPQRVLDIACGTGSIAVRLAEKGLHVVGIDLSPQMIAQARQTAEGLLSHKGSVHFEVMDAAEITLPPQSFDTAVCLFDSLNYIVDPERVRSALRGIRRVLTPGGLFIFDINTRHALETCMFDQDNLHTSQRLKYIWRSTFDPATRLSTIRMRFLVSEPGRPTREMRETHIQYAYEVDELTTWLSEAGFCGVETLAAYTLQPLEPDTDRAFFVARAET